MYYGIKILSSEIDKNNPNTVIHHYQLCDDEIPHINSFFSASIAREDGSGYIWDDTAHTDKILYSLYSIYKYSRFSVCSVFPRILALSFPTDNATNIIQKTIFYKEHKKLIDKSWKERKIYANIY